MFTNNYQLCLQAKCEVSLMGKMFSNVQIKAAAREGVQTPPEFIIFMVPIKLSL